jgi:DASH complex subunit ASK1
MIRQRQHVFETPDSSPFYPRKAPATGYNEDQLLHRVLDKNWRLQATPLGKPPPSRYRGNAATMTPKPRALPPPDSESPMPSPPKLRYYDIFSSPIKAGAGGGPKTPVGKRYAMAKDTTANKGGGYAGDSDDSDMDFPEGLGQPVTVQFSLPPSMLLATPAREASRRIVHDILRTAGAAADESSSMENSPPVVRAMISPEDDTF